MKSVKNLLKGKKGIDTILAALLMVVIVVVASVMVYAWSTGLLGTLLVTPQTGKEALNIEGSASFTSNNSTILSIRNTGSASVTLVSYYVRDNSNNQYALTTWNGPQGIAPNALSQPTINIGKACTGCTYNGAAYTATTAGLFNFVSGNSYTVIVVTSRNNQFTFTIVR